VTEKVRCLWCGRGFIATPGPGRPRRYCKQSCRQRDYESRRRSDELGIGEAELVVARRSLDDLYDRLYVLEAAIEDVDRDLAAGDSANEVRAALEWLLDAARPLVDSPRP
jgi:hypothetical protein